MSTPSADTHIIALHQALIPNWTSPAFSKFVDATRALVDELANTTTARDGKEEMVRCEEIFRQICWLEERFWPVVNGMGDMGEQDEPARLGPPGLSTMNNGNFAGPSPNMGPPMNSQMAGPMTGHNNQMVSHGHSNSQLNGGMPSNGMNTPMNGSGMNGSLNNSGMTRPMPNAQMTNNHNGSQIDGSQLNGQLNQMNGRIQDDQSSGSSTPGADDNAFGQLQMVQGS